MSWADLHPGVVEIAVADPRLEGLKILHLSDLHLRTPAQAGDLKRLITRINASGADFVAITGDLIDAPVRRIRPLLELFSQLRIPAWFVSGNHDHFYGLDPLREILERAGVGCLEDSSVAVEFRGISLRLAGVPDRFGRVLKGRRDRREWLRALATEETPLIFLAHQPKDYRLALQAESALFLCGHTHGGQIWPFHWLVRLSQPFLDGAHRRKETAIYVSRGVGTWGIHRRYKAPAELPLLLLSAAV